MIPLPCPWCALEWVPLSEGEAEAQKDAPASHAKTLAFFDGYDNPHSNGIPNDYSIAIYCPRCKASGPEVRGDEDSDTLTNEAVRLWNERARR